MTIVIVNKNDNLFSTDCQRAVSGRFSSVPAPQPPALTFSATPAPPDFRPLRSRSAHVLCVRASHDENSAKPMKTEKQHEMKDVKMKTVKMV